MNILYLFVMALRVHSPVLQCRFHMLQAVQASLGVALPFFSQRYFLSTARLFSFSKS